ARSADLLEQGLAHFRDFADERDIALALATLRATMRVQGNLTRSVALLEGGLTRYEALDVLDMTAIAQTTLAVTATRQGQRGREMHNVLSALTGHARRGDRWFAMFDRRGVAEVLIMREQPESAVRLLGAAQALEDALGSAVGVVTYGDLLESARSLFSA